MYGKGDLQSSNLESEEPPQEEVLPQKEALYLPQVKTSNLKHNFPMKYLTSMKVINIYHVLEPRSSNGRGKRRKRTFAVIPNPSNTGFSPM